LSIGAPLDEFQGVLRGVPTFVGNVGPHSSRPNESKDHT
jgi:hypothetical protein